MVEIAAQCWTRHANLFAVLSIKAGNLFHVCPLRINYHHVKCHQLPITTAIETQLLPNQP